MPIAPRIIAVLARSLVPPQVLLPAMVMLPVLCLLPTAARAQLDAGSEYRLQVRPSICVSYDSQAPCRMSMAVSWESNRTADVCLLQALRDEPLACWDNAREGSTEVQYADTSDVQYRLVDARSRAVLAETDVVVINRDLRSSRKRRRHVWSIL